MDLMHRSRAYMALAATLVLICLVFLTGVLDRQMTWVDMPYLMMDFDGGLAREGEPCGAMNKGPGLDLPAGEYRVKWTIEGDADNRLMIVTENGVQAEPAQILLPAGQMQGEAVFTLPAAAQGVDIRVSFDGGSFIRVHDMRLYSPMYRDHAFTFALLALAVCALVVLHFGGWLTPARRGKLILIGMAGLALWGLLKLIGLF